MFWGVEQERALDREKPQTHATPVAVKVDLNLPSAPWGADGLGSGIRSLQAKGERCDIDLEVGGEVFAAHQIMLASMSKAFRMFLKHLRVSGDAVEATEETLAGGILSVVQPPAPPPAASNAATPDASAQPASAPPTEVAPPAATEAPSAGQDAPATPAPEAVEGSAGTKRLKLHVNGISRPESMKILLNYIYQVGTGLPFEYKPSCVEVDKDVLNLARHFELDHLHEYAARWLIDGLSTLNVVERLVVCEEFQLGNLREKMMEQLAAFPDALGIVSSNPDIMKHPKIMQDLLKSVAFSTKKEKVPEKKTEEKASDKPEKTERAEKAEKAEKPERQEKPEKSDNVEKAEKNAEKGEKKAEKATEKQERPSAEKPPPAKKARKAGGA